MSTTPTEFLWFDAENVTARLNEETLTVANMLFFSATVDIFHFLNFQGFGNPAYAMMRSNLIQIVK